MATDVKAKTPMARDLTDLLHSIATGDVQAFYDVEPWSYCNVLPSFRTQCGWRFGVFNDCDEVDYIEWAVNPEGRREEYDDWANADGQSSNPIDLFDCEGGCDWDLHEALESASKWEAKP